MTNIKNFPRKNAIPTEQLPENCQNTEAYIMQEVLYSDAKTKTVTDFVSGEDRNRRWGMVVSLAVIPQFDQVAPNQGPVLLPRTPSRFFTADNLEDLKARIVYEIDKAISMAKLAVENPEEFIRKQTEGIRAQLEAEAAEQGTPDTN
jgi:hypothetical protein